MRLILGLGTGRCGTKSVARLLHNQEGVVASHEYKYPYKHEHRVSYEKSAALLRWDGNSSIDPLVKDLRSRDCEVAADVSFYALPYVGRFREEFDTSVFHIQRDRSEVVESYCKWMGERNHWNPKEGEESVWDRCYPTYDPGLALEEAVGRYYDEYCEAADDVADYKLRTADLNDGESMENFAEWAGISDFTYEQIRANQT